MHFDFLSCFRVSKINMASANGEMSVTEPSDTEIAEEVKILDDNEVPLTPDTAAEEARKEEIRLQITKVLNWRALTLENDTSHRPTGFAPTELCS